MKQYFRKTYSSQAISHQLIRYLIVGGVAWLVDFTLFALTYATLGIFSAQTLARIAGALVGFAGHKRVVFQNRSTLTKSTRNQAIQYALLWLFSYLASLTLLYLLVHPASQHPVIAKLITETLILGFNFTAMRRYVFADRSNA
ncbi:MAG: GtrA family protein [Candidatus Thiodiazotropha sp.]